MPGREILHVQVDEENVLEIISKMKRTLEKFSLVKCGIFSAIIQLKSMNECFVMQLSLKDLHKFQHSNLIPRVFLSTNFFSNKATINTRGKSCP